MTRRMTATYTYPRYGYAPSAAQREGRVERHPVVVVGAGPIGLTAALDLAQRGLPVLLLDDNDTVSIGSRAVCYAKRPLEIWDRLGAAAPMVDKGVSWQLGRVYFRDELAYSFNLQPEPRHQMPAMINLQQYHLEEMLIAAIGGEPRITLAWKHRLLSLQQQPDHALLSVETPDGIFQLQADWVVACDGANSDTRRMVGAGFTGQFFQDRFLIADVVMKADFPTERWFWFDPPFHRGQSVLLHKQSDNVWRIDFQLGWDADPEEEKKPERVLPRIRAMLGPEADFELEWVSVYQFACRRIDRFRHGRVIFAGDAAHLVSPFGARGANSGFQDVDNLGWKLALVVAGRSPSELLDSYDAERILAADENIRHSTRSTDFITPKSDVSRTYRDAVLQLAKRHPFARRLVNSGRLSTPSVLAGSALNTPDRDPDFPAHPGAMVPGAPAADAPVDGPEGPWLLAYLEHGFTLLAFGPLPADAVDALGRLPVPVRVVQVGVPAAPGAVALADVEGLAAKRYAALPGTCYLLRPDQHVCARWRAFDPGAVKLALARATARIGDTTQERDRWNA